MGQWLKLHQNNSFVNPMQRPLLCEKSGTMLLRSSSRSYIRQADKYCKFKILCYIFTAFKQRYGVIVLPLQFSQFSWVKHTVRQVKQVCRNWMLCFCVDPYYYILLYLMMLVICLYTGSYIIDRNC